MRELCVHAPVAQLDRVLGYEPRGQRFESSPVRFGGSTLPIVGRNHLNFIEIDDCNS